MEHFRAVVKDLTFKMPNFFHKLNEFYILTNGDDDDKIAIIATTGNKTEWCIFLKSLMDFVGLLSKKFYSLENLAHYSLCVYVLFFNEDHLLWDFCNTFVS